MIQISVFKLIALIMSSIALGTAIGWFIGLYFGFVHGVKAECFGTERKEE